MFAVSDCSPLVCNNAEMMIWQVGLSGGYWLLAVVTIVGVTSPTTPPCVAAHQPYTHTDREGQTGVQ